MSPPSPHHLHRSYSDVRAPLLRGHQKDDDPIANPPGETTSRQWRIMIDVGLLFGAIFMLLWPWALFVFISANDGIEMWNFLSNIDRQYPQRVAALVTLLGTGNQFLVTILLSQIILRLGEELVRLDRVTVFQQGKGLARSKRRLAVVLLFLGALGASSLIPSGTAALITPGAFNKAAELRGTEIDFTSDDPGCLEWLERHRLTNLCDWKEFGGTQYTTCLGENQMLDVLDSGRANVLDAIEVTNETSTFNQLGEDGGLRFRGSAKGILPIGPNGIRAVNTVQNSSNPFASEQIRERMVSYNYTLNQQGLTANINCSYDNTSPIRFRSVNDTNTTLIMSSFGICDSAAGMEEVLEGVINYVTLNANNTLTYWACKQPPQPGSQDPTYFVHLRGRGYYKSSIGNITCRISPMRAQDYLVDYLSGPGYFTASRSHDAQSAQKPTFYRYIEWGLVGFGNMIWEGQNWSSHLAAETVFSLAMKKLKIPSAMREQNPISLKMFEAMVQGMLEYGATYSRLVYTINKDIPTTCLRDVTGSVSYSVRGWHINPGDVLTQAGLLVPMTLINLASLVILIKCFVLGRFQYRERVFDMANNISLLTASVPDEDRVKWGDKVRYRIPGSNPVLPPTPNEKEVQHV
ncbi:hypothetical protein MD484_g7644, partial [Candolleomyces efflorescens]